MIIYFACSITGGRKDEQKYSRIVSYLLENGHVVPTAGLADKDVMKLEKIVNPIEVYERDIGWIRESEVLIAEISTPSHGVGYEIGYALDQSIPVICLYQEGKSVSKMILGNRNPKLTTFAYVNIEDALEFIKNYLLVIKPD
jgi:nucleoside 2-deoxyribosyltransferase